MRQALLELRLAIRVLAEGVLGGLEGSLRVLELLRIGGDGVEVVSRARVLRGVDERPVAILGALHAVRALRCQDGHLVHLIFGEVLLQLLYLFLRPLRTEKVLVDRSQVLERAEDLIAVLGRDRHSLVEPLGHSEARHVARARPLG